MSQILRREKKPGDVLTADDYNIDAGLPMYRIRVYKENITLNTQTSREVELATFTLEKPTFMSIMLYYKQYMKDVVIKNPHPTETIITKLTTSIRFYRSGDDTPFTGFGYVEIYGIPPSSSITLDITNHEMGIGIYRIVNRISVSMRIDAYIQANRADTDAEVFIPKTWVFVNL